MKTVYYNTSTSSLYDVERGRELPSASFPWIRFREKIDLKIFFITGLDTNGDPVADTTLDASLVYEAAIDKDYSTATTVMAKTLNDDIVVDASAGSVLVTIDANTAEFQAAINTKSKLTGIFELQGNDVDELVWSIDFKINCKGSINTDAEEPDPVPASEYYTKTETDALIGSGGSGATRVANIAALPASPYDMQSCMVTTLGQIVSYDLPNAVWIYANGTTVEVGDES